MSKDFIDFNNKWSYPIQWLWESKDSRWEYAHLMYKVDLAMEGKSCKNLYKEEVTNIVNALPEDEKRKAKDCVNVPEEPSFALRKAIENRANQMSGGVDTYEYQINDPYGIIKEDTEDLLAAKCEQDYIENHLESLSPTFSRDLSKYGMTAVIVRYDQCKDENIVERVNPKNVWFDTKYSSTGRERFRGYSRMISWAELKKILKREQDEINLEMEVPDRSAFNKNGELDKHIKIGKKKIKTLNDLDIYIEDMNKLAQSPSLQAPITEFWEYDHDLRSCYNAGWYHTFATDPKAKTKSGYNGDDVELTIIYDLGRKIEFKIINRRFVISANKKAFKRKIAFKIHNPVTDEIKYRVDDFCLDCPLKFQFEEWEDRDKLHFPISPAMRYLPLHDELCAWRSKRSHVSKILAILRVETNGADADSLKKVFNIMGVILDDIQGDINTIQFPYDYTAIDSQIQYLETTIMEGLHAYDQFDALQNMGDRASAAESGMAIGAIAQGLATHQNAIMGLYADIARQCIANRVAYSNNSEFPVNNLGDYSSITIQEMALSAIVVVKPKLAKKVQERMIATNALTLLGTLKDVLTPEGVAYFSEQALMGNVPRKLAATFIKRQGATEQEVALAQQQAQNQAQMLQQNEQAYQQNPVPYEVNNVMQSLSPDEIDAVVNGIAETAPTEIAEEQATTEEVMPQPVETTSQDMGLSASLEGLTPESGSAMANNSMV